MRIILSFVFIFISILSFGQNQGNVWFFGQYAGITFNTNPPSALAGGQLTTTEGCSGISDATTGNLLFYTDGITVWDKNNTPMPSSVATPLNGDPSSTQSGVVVPLPGNPNIYYVFTTPAQLGNWTFTQSSLCYSIIDMSLNGGNGDVTTTNVPIMDSTTEKIAAVGGCNGLEYWIVGHKWNCDSFYAFKLTAAGLSAPIKSTVGAVHQDMGSGQLAESIGYMKFSSDGKKLGLVTYDAMNLMQMFDFDMNTGIITGPYISEQYPVNIGSGDGLYGCSFSPDNSRFYVSYFSNGGSNFIYQYDMNAGSSNAVLASKTQVATSVSPMGAIQNGPDGKMYISSYGAFSLDAINSPNTLGVACNYQSSVLNLGTGMATFGLPVVVESFLSPSVPHFNIPAKNEICVGDTIHGPQTTKSNFEIYPSSSVFVSPDSSYVDFFPTTNTTYTIVNSSACAKNDTLFYTITILPNPIANFEFDPLNPTLVDNTINLVNQTQNGDHYEWFLDFTLLGTSKDLTINNPGTGTFCYTLIAYNTLNCPSTVNKCITIKDTINSSFFIPNAFTPNGDGLNDLFKLKGKHIDMNLFSIFNRFGQLLFQTDDLSTGWNGDYKGVQCEMGTYFYLINYSDVHGNAQTLKGDFELIR